jgi:membrane-associated phospholipid phosphatase
MEAVLSSGIDTILWLQSFRSPGLDRFFEILTNFGGSYYLYLMPALLWCVDYRTGLRVLALFTLTLFLNTTIKEWIAQPRPFDYDDRVWSDGEQGYGLPSGHAQLVVVFWGGVASWVAKPGFWGVAVAVMFMMGLSRVYLGVHFPSDVAGGWALGALTLWWLLRNQSKLEGFIARFPLAGPAGLALAAGVFVFAFDGLFVNDHGHLNQGVAGLVAGGGAGAAIAQRRLHFDGRGPLWQRALRYLLGTALMLMLLGLFQKLGVPEGPLSGLVIALDLAVLGLWLTLAAPWLFQLVKLAERPARA